MCLPSWVANRKMSPNTERNGELGNQIMILNPFQLHSWHRDFDLMICTSLLLIYPSLCVYMGVYGCTFMSYRLIFMNDNRFELFLLYEDCITTAVETFTMPVSCFSLTLELDFQPLSTTKICHNYDNLNKSTKQTNFIFLYKCKFWKKYYCTTISTTPNWIKSCLCEVSWCTC